VANVQTNVTFAMKLSSHKNGGEICCDLLFNFFKSSFGPILQHQMLSAVV